MAAPPGKEAKMEKRGKEVGDVGGEKDASRN